MSKNSALNITRIDNRRPLKQLTAAVLLCLILISVFSATADARGVLIAAAAERPTIDLNGPDEPGIDHIAVTFVEDQGPVTIVAENLAIISNRAQISSASITLEAKPDGSLETLDISADLAGTKIAKSYNQQKGILRLTGVDTVGNYETVLRTVTYDNLSQAPDESDRFVSFIINDGSGSSDPAGSTVPILGVNDAPVLDNGGDMQLDDIHEDDQKQIGNVVSVIIASAEKTGIDRITDPDDPDGIEAEGIAVIDVGNGNGTWQFSIDSGSSWLQFGTVSDSSAVLLDEDARVRFLPNNNYSGQAGFTFRAWDQTSSASPGERADVSLNGGTSPFSVASEIATVDVLAINDRPLVDLNGRLPGVDYSAAFLSRDTAVALAATDAFVYDLESSELTSLTVVLQNRPDGTAESLFVSDRRGDIQITPYDPATGELRLEGTATLSDYSAMLQGLRYVNTAEAMSDDERVVAFAASDGTESSATSFSRLMPVLSNSAPLLDPDAGMKFTETIEDDADPAGDTVRELLNRAIPYPVQDADADALRGFAVIDAENQDGAWQFSIDSGKSWLAVGSVSDSAALLLNADARLRFVPSPDFSGESRQVTVRAWDQTEGANGMAGFDATTNGANTAISTASTAVPIMVTAVNDAPVLTISNDTIAEFSEGSGPVVVTGPTLQISDVDNENLESATVFIDNLLLNEPDILEATPNGSGIVASYNQATGTLGLEGTATLAEYQAVLRFVTFNNLSQDPSEEDRQIGFIVSDGTAASEQRTSIVRVEAINDTPLLDLNGEDLEGSSNVVSFDKDSSGSGGSVELADNLQLQDVDNTTLIGAIVTLQKRPDGSRESLSVNTGGTNITAVSSDAGGEIVLSGQDTLGAYQQVLRTAVYTNSSPYANRALRDISFAVQDTSLGTTAEISTVIVQPQYALVPLIAHQAVGQPLVEEPNDTCEEALAIANDVDYSFGAEDINDWFSFSLAKTTGTTVELREFAPERGQLVIASGTCGDLKLAGHNGDFSTTKIVKLGALKAGRYYIWVINDGPTNLGKPYHLRVRLD